MIEAIVILALTFGGGFWTGKEFTEGRQAEIDLRIEQAARSSREAAAEEIRKIEIKHTTIQNEFKEVVRVEKVYQDCKHSPEAWRILMRAYDEQ